MTVLVVILNGACCFPTSQLHVLKENQVRDVTVETKLYNNYSGGKIGSWPSIVGRQVVVCLAAWRSPAGLAA